MINTHSLLIDYGILSMGQPICAFEVEKLLKKVQKDAYNCALEDAADITITTYKEINENWSCGECDIFENNILNLKNK